MKKLDIKDLAIGDWVYSSFSSTPCKIQALSLTDNGFATVCVSGVDGVKDIASLSPIPLTPEILKRNEFYFGNTSQESDMAHHHKVLFFVLIVMRDNPNIRRLLTLPIGANKQKNGCTKTMVKDNNISEQQ